MSPRANSRECQTSTQLKSMCVCVRCSIDRNNSRNNSTSSNHVRPPKKGAASTPDEHPKASSEAESGGTDPHSTAADNENATDASIEITTSTTNSTAIINDSPQSPLSPSQQCNGNNPPPQPPAVVTEGTTDSITNSNSAATATASATTKQPSRARAKTDHAKYGFDVVWIVPIFTFCVDCFWKRLLHSFLTLILTHVTSFNHFYSRFCTYEINEDKF